MPLSGITGVLSRYFLLGYFVPAFFTLFALSQLLTTDFVPNGFEELTPGNQALVLGAAALLLGLILLGLRYPTTRAFEGYPVEFGLARRLNLRAPFIFLQRSSYDRLKKTRDDERAKPYERNYARRVFGRRFHPDRDRLLPTRFGNAYRAFERYPFDRWGLDMIAVWPLVHMLLNEQERELHTNAESDVAFFRNCVLGSLAVGGVLLADGIVNHPLDLEWWGWTLYVLPFAIAYLLYRPAIGAAERLGTERKASVAIHRLELYELLGLRGPTSPTDEKFGLARAVNRFLLRGEEIPVKYVKTASEVKGGDTYVGGRV